LALETIGLRQGDEVIVTTMTFAVTAEVVTYFHARPLLDDCCWDTLNIDVERIEKAITPKTTAIIPIHFGGQPCDLNSILDLARAITCMLMKNPPTHFQLATGRKL